MLLTMENKNIEFSVDHREYQMALIMNLPKNTPKGAMKLICEIQKERDFLLEQNEQLKENQLTEENAMDYIYQHSDKYEDWIEDSTTYNDLWNEHKELKEEHEKLKKYKIFENELLIGEVDKLKAEHEKLKEDHGQLKLLAEPMFRVILNHENN